MRFLAGGRSVLRCGERSEFWRGRLLLGRDPRDAAVNASREARLPGRDERFTVNQTHAAQARWNFRAVRRSA
jgi:hypothetical protein